MKTHSSFFCWHHWFRNVFASVLGIAVVCGLTATLAVADNENPTVGAPGVVKDVVLPGPELTGKPIGKKEPMIVRVVDAIKHGDGFRYEIRFQGFEAGKYDLSKWLIRVDGSPAEGLPPVEVEIRSLLNPEDFKPNELQPGWIPRLGGYQRVASAVAILWGLVLLGLIFLRRSKPKQVQQTEKSETLADLLYARLARAQDNQLSQGQYAELERMLFGFWCKRLALEQLPMNEAMSQIKSHEAAGPLMRQLEKWMHSPRREQNVDLASLVEPYREIPLGETEAMHEKLKQIHAKAGK